MDRRPWQVLGVTMDDRPVIAVSKLPTEPAMPPPRQDPPTGIYRTGNHSPLTVWLEQAGGPNIHIGMASSPEWAQLIARALNMLAAAEAERAKPCKGCADGTLCDRHHNAELDRLVAEEDAEDAPLTPRPCFCRSCTPETT